jgi:hypothetical protein
MGDGLIGVNSVGIFLVGVFIWAIFEGHPWVAIFVLLGSMK